MPSKDYDHYFLLSVEDLISMIEKKDKEIMNIKKKYESLKASRDKYAAYNQFHMEEITRLDKQIGKYKKQDS